MREFVVTEAMPQKNCAPITMINAKIAQLLPNESRKIPAGAAMFPVAGYWNAAAASKPA